MFQLAASKFKKCEITMRTLSTISFVVMLFTLVNTSTAGNSGPRTWDLSDAKINYLLAGDVCQQIGLTEWRMGRKRLGVNGWTETEQIFKWPVLSSHSGKAQVTLLVKTPANTGLILKSNRDMVKLVIEKSGWQRITTNLELDKGNEQIQLGLNESTQAAIIGLEVISSVHLPIHRQRISKLQSLRGNPAWFQNAGFGLMFQWGYWGYPKQGERKQPWQKVYKDFDIEAFTDKMKQINPGYLIWSITWRGSRFSLPLKSVDEIMGSNGFTMEYDFLGKLADALHKRNIPLFLYYHPVPRSQSFGAKCGKAMITVSIIKTAILKSGLRSGSAWEQNWPVGLSMAAWLSITQLIFMLTKSLLTAGNSQRLTTCNPWIFPNCSPFDDMSMGENHAPGKRKRAFLSPVLPRG